MSHSHSRSCSRSSRRRRSKPLASQITSLATFAAKAAIVTGAVVGGGKYLIDYGMERSEQARQETIAELSDFRDKTLAMGVQAYTTNLETTSAEVRDLLAETEATIEGQRVALKQDATDIVGVLSEETGVQLAAVTETVGNVEQIIANMDQKYYPTVAAFTGLAEDLRNPDRVYDMANAAASGATDSPGAQQVIASVDTFSDNIKSVEENGTPISIVGTLVSPITYLGSLFEEEAPEADQKTSPLSDEEQQYFLAEIAHTANIRSGR